MTSYVPIWNPVEVSVNLGEVKTSVQLLNMTQAQWITVAMSRLGKRESLNLRRDVVNEVNLTLDRLSRGTFLPWFLIKTTELNYTANSSNTWIVQQDSLLGGPDFLREVENTRPYYIKEGKIYYLEKRFYSVLQGEEPSTIRYYSIFGQNEFHVRKIPEENTTFYLVYYARPTPPLTDTDDPVENLWLIHAQDWVTYESLANVASMQLSNAELSDKFTAAAIAARRELFVHHEALKHENQDYYMGGASDGT